MAAWQVMDSGPLLPEEVMAKDALLLHQMNEESRPLLHFYEWKVPSLTYGYFTDIEKYLDLESLKKNGLKSARRPTGGGIIFHLSDFAFSLFLPASDSHYSLNPLDNYGYLNQRVANAIASLRPQAIHPHLLQLGPPSEHDSCQAFCMARGTKYDLIIEGKKVGGAAQRRTKQGLLHQGSISIKEPPMILLKKVLKNPGPVLEAMKQHSYYFLPEDAEEKILIDAKVRLKERLSNEFQTIKQR